MEKFFEIGVITGTHGIRGTMRVFPTRFYGDKPVLLRPPHNTVGKCLFQHFRKQCQYEILFHALNPSSR